MSGDDYPRWYEGDIPRLLAEGWKDDELLDRFGFYPPRPTFQPTGSPPPRAPLPLRERRRLEAFIAAAKSELGVKRRRSDPIATPNQAQQAFREFGSERKAAKALKVSKTQLRRLLGKDV